MKPFPLNCVIFGHGSHEAAWRMPESDPLAVTTAAFWTEIAVRAETAGFDALFLGDVLAMQQGTGRHVAEAMDPFVVLSALAMVTERIGLIGTASTTFDHPYHLARRFAALDHLSGGRGGWNIVTSSNALEAGNFGLAAMPDHAERYARAADVVAASLALWQSRDGAPPTPDKAAGVYLDEAALRHDAHDGPYVRTDGPLNLPRPPQGRPLLAQAGSSEAGRAFAAHHADIVFTVQSDLDAARTFRADIRARAEQAGRDPDSIRVLPGIVPVLAETREEAETRLAALNAFGDPAHLRAKLGEFLNADLSGLDPDRPIPAGMVRIDTNQSSRSRAEVLMALAERDGLTLRQLMLRLASGRGHLLVVGTGPDMAARMAEWRDAGAADGFNVMLPVLPGDIATFHRLAVPALVEAGLRPDRPADMPLRARYGLAPVV